MTAAIEFRDVHKRFGELQALAGIDLDVQKGEFFGLLGPNGAGKTTLISILAGLVRADRGIARVMGHDVRSDYRAARRSLGVVPQELVFDPFFSVRETLRIQSGYFGLRDNGAWIDEVMQHLDLAAKADVNMRALSGGMKRRVLIAQALVHKPPVIVLDEPTASMDAETEAQIFDHFRSLTENRISILISHRFSTVRHADAIVVLDEGQVIEQGTHDELMRLGGRYARLFELQARAYR